MGNQLKDVGDGMDIGQNGWFYRTFDKSLSVVTGKEGYRELLTG